MSLDRKIDTVGIRNKTPEKENAMVAKLGPDKYHWAWEVQTRPFPDWSAAFDYAYKLGLERGKNEAK